LNIRGTIWVIMIEGRNSSEMVRKSDSDFYLSYGEIQSIQNTSRTETS